jgi:hypothetical protein
MQDYRPPFESPIEDAFAWVLSKHIGEQVELLPQVEVKTFAGSFRVDLLARSPNRRIAIECDGRDYHDYRRDMFRDSIILGETSIDGVYRFRGTDICGPLEDSLYSFSTLEPGLFSRRGHKNLRQLASRRRYQADCTELVVTFLGGRSAVIRALRREHANPVWKRLYHYARDHRELSLDEIIRQADLDNLKWFSD